MTTTKYTQDEILARANGFAQEWIDSVSFDGKHNLEVILSELGKRTGPPPGNNQCIVRVVDSPLKITEAYFDALNEAKERGLIEPPPGSTLDAEMERLRAQISEAERCVWDYYLMAFYESTMKAAGLSHFFTDQSFLPAFKAGLGYVINYGDILIGVTLPEAHFDNENRLHSQNKAALAWNSDDRSKSVEEFWFRGTRVQKDWILYPNSVDPSLALTWENIEERRALSEILGWGKVIASLKPRTIDTDENPQIGTLLEVDLPDSPKSRFLKVKCGTGRDFVLPVPGFVNKKGDPVDSDSRGAIPLNTALEANAWTYNLDPKVLLKLHVRT